MPDHPRIETAITEVPSDLAIETAAALGGGAVCSFLGRTRPEIHPDHGALVALDYDAARPLADRLLRSLADDVATRHGLRYLAIRHMIGRVPVGAASVGIVAVADHRDAAFVACREAIDRTKSEIPIWKQECWPDTTSWSSDATPLSADAGAAG